eukprot:130326-Chlamydomonas_euryale.AAC.4
MQAGLSRGGRGGSYHFQGIASDEGGGPEAQGSAGSRGRLPSVAETRSLGAHVTSRANWPLKLCMNCNCGAQLT